MNRAGPLVAVQDLTIRAGGRPVVHGVSFTLPPGGSLGLVGASGSGKTTTALTLLGYVHPGLVHSAGTVRVRGAGVLPDPPAWLRGGTVGYLPQDPGQSLNPYQRIGALLLTATGHRVPRPRRAAVVSGLLERVGLPGDPQFARRFPHQLSGGQQQRVALAVALGRSPSLLVLDEPTTGLDPDTKAEVLAGLARIHAGGVAMLWVSHDLTTLGGAVGRLLVLERGRVVEDAATEQVFCRPVSDAAIRLVAAVPRPVLADPPEAPDPPPVLTVSGLVAAHGPGPAVLNGVDLTARRGECLVVLGASGVGKTTLARCLAGLHHPVRGTMSVDGEPVSLDVRRRTRAQRARVQLVAQDPAGALHPRHTVHTAVARPLRVLHGMRAGAALDRRVQDLLAAVHLDPEHARRLPGELSGGQRQRVALARALAAEPQVLLCDEITSALDLVTQAAVLDLLAELRRRLGLAVVLVTHDLAMAATVADRLVVLVDGRVVEDGCPADVLGRPTSATGRRLRGLLGQDPIADAGRAAAPPRRVALPGHGWGDAGVVPGGVRFPDTAF